MVTLCVGIGVTVGAGMVGATVGGTGVLVGGNGVTVGGMGVSVGGNGVAVGGAGVAVGGAGVKVARGKGVSVGDAGGLMVIWQDANKIMSNRSEKIRLNAFIKRLLGLNKIKRGSAPQL